MVEFIEQLEGVTILVAEDDEGILSLLKTFFDTHGATVHTVIDGRSVKEKVKLFRPDIILLDVVMPYLDGISALSALRKSGDTTPVIMLTDKSAISDKVRGLDSGADDYMAKPFSTRELLSRIKSLLRRTGTKTRQKHRKVLSFGNVQIDMLSRQIFVDGNDKLQLTKTEFDLLCYLTERKSVVASHSDLLNDVMGYKNPVETKALVMHIANIRKKMMKMGVRGAQIRTVAGVGYMLKEE